MEIGVPATSAERAGSVTGTSRFTRLTEVTSATSIDCVAGWVYAMSVPDRDTAGVSTVLTSSRASPEPSGRVETAFGTCPGRILATPRGELGFGYDPIFAPEGSERALAEFTASEKEAISHRGAAIRSLIPAIRAAIGRGVFDEPR